jgi:hypothetical protein
MPSTPYFGWSTPADTDYVTNGALSIRTLGNDADFTVKQVQDSVSNLDAATVKKAGDTMTGTLTTANNGLPLVVREDVSGNVGIIISDSTNTTEQGSLRFTNNTYSTWNLTSNGNQLVINNFGDTARVYDGDTRPIAFATQAGYQTSIAANSSASVSFASGRFLEIPIVLITGVSTSGTVTTGHVGNISTSGFTIYNTTSATRNFFWQAIQMLSNSAAG